MTVFSPLLGSLIQKRFFDMAFFAPFFIIVVFVYFPSIVLGWGSLPIPDSLRPETSWQTSFPSNPTVTVSAGASAQDAINRCNSAVGITGYCTVQLLGNPSESTIHLDRSRTKLTSAPGVEMTSSGKTTFIALNKPGLEQVIIDSLSLRGHRAEEVFGVFVQGRNLNKIIIRNNKIFNFDGWENAHGIAVYGNEREPIKDMVIDSNEVYNMRTGSSESIVVNGNVFKWAITKNHVHDVNNIAIDAIAGEGTLAPLPGASRPNPDDAATGGFIENNLVERMSTRTNPAYGNEDSWAAGIYVDGAQTILIEGNQLVDTPWAIEIGAENCVVATDIIVRHNKASKSFYGDFLAGGYARRGFLTHSSIECNPFRTRDEDEGHGHVQRITVGNNTFSTTTGSEDNILAQYRTTYAIIAEPGVSPGNENGNGSAPGDENAIRISE